MFSSWPAWPGLARRGRGSDRQRDEDIRHCGDVTIRLKGTAKARSPGVAGSLQSAVEKLRASLSAMQGREQVSDARGWLRGSRPPTSLRAGGHPGSLPGMVPLCPRSELSRVPWGREIGVRIRGMRKRQADKTKADKAEQDQPRDKARSPKRAKAVAPARTIEPPGETERQAIKAAEARVERRSTRLKVAVDETRTGINLTSSHADQNGFSYRAL